MAAGATIAGQLLDAWANLAGCVPAASNRPTVRLDTQRGRVGLAAVAFQRALNKRSASSAPSSAETSSNMKL